MSNLLAQVNIWQQTPQINRFETPGALISVILKNVYMFAGILLFVMVIIGGYSIIAGAGENDPKKTGSGKKTLTTALIGFLIIFASYWIIKIIEKITGLGIVQLAPGRF